MIMQYVVGTKPRITVEAKVYRACLECGHSGIVNGVYHADLCPQCHTVRPPVEDRGLIYDNSPWFQLKRQIKNYFNKYIKGEEI